MTEYTHLSDIKVKGKISADEIGIIDTNNGNEQTLTDIIADTTVKTANHASSADFADNATNATNATNAVKASQDASGKVITETYVTKTTKVAGHALNGDITLSPSDVGALAANGTAVMATSDASGRNIADTYATQTYVDTELAKKQNTLTIDNVLSADSENPVQNKVVKAAIDAKVDKTTYDAGIASKADKSALDTLSADYTAHEAEYDAHIVEFREHLEEVEQGLLEKYDTSTKVDEKIAAAIASTYRHVGSVTNYSELPSTGNAVGDVYHVTNANGNIPAGTNYAWNGTAWDALGGEVNLSNYVTKTVADSSYLGKTATATMATALASDGGSATKPVFFSGGKPVACNDTLAVDITGNAATATSAGSATTAGSCTGNAATATTAESATKATQDGNGNNIVNTYQKKVMTGTFTVAASSWTASSVATGYGYQATISATGVTEADYPVVSFDPTFATGGQLAPFADTVAGGIRIYSKVNTIAPTGSWMAVDMA